MRKYSPKNDASQKNYYKDRFFIPEETPKSSANESDFKDDLSALEGVQILNSYVEFSAIVLYVEPTQNLAALRALKGAGYEILCELSGVDFTEARGGIEVFYQLLDIKRARRARLKCFVANESFLQSAVGIYKSANWAERELYDMMGVWIENHPNLARLIMPDDWFGHPLLKSYPLQGDEFAKWYEVDKIFGVGARERIGEENRNSAFVDEKDTFNFTRLYHEGARGEPRPQEKILQEYQEEGGVRFVKRAKRGIYKIITKRK